uniref:Ig-like domain-containing protein n=1 Tax=Periophthalmus magnuspinnatus TaxID=409849 RepID=A0A3B4BKP7_9GOBI
MELIWEKEEKEAMMTCSHTKGAGYSQMYWYRQLPGEAMRLVVFTLYGKNDHDFGEFNKEKYSAHRPNAESGTFTVKDLKPADKAMYFCAVSQHNESN